MGVVFFGIAVSAVLLYCRKVVIKPGYGPSNHRLPLIWLRDSGWKVRDQMEACTTGFVTLVNTVQCSDFV